MTILKIPKWVFLFFFFFFCLPFRVNESLLFLHEMDVTANRNEFYTGATLITVHCSGNWHDSRYQIRVKNDVLPVQLRLPLIRVPVNSFPYSSTHQQKPVEAWHWVAWYPPSLLHWGTNIPGGGVGKDSRIPSDSFLHASFLSFKKKGILYKK